MWISSREPNKPGDGSASLGTVTISGESPGVHLAGERRGVEVFAPAGYHWVPRQKDAVLVMKGGEEQAPFLLGKKNVLKKEIELGEVFISVSPESGIHLKRDGTINLMGEILLNGTRLLINQLE